jgi:hypothetical protein
VTAALKTSCSAKDFAYRQAAVLGFTWERQAALTALRSVKAVSPKTPAEFALVTTTIPTAGSSVVLAGSMITGSHNIFISVFMTIEQLSFLPLVNMDLTTNQVDLYIGSNQLQGLPNFIPGLHCAPPQDKRKNYDFDCTNFLRIAQKDWPCCSA